MPSRSSLTVWLVTAGAFFAFFVFGFSDNLKGPTLPALLRDLDLSYSLGGTILFGAYVGFVLANFFTGFLSDLAGKKAPLMVAGGCLALGILGFTLGDSAGWLTAMMVVFGMGLGAIELGANAIIVDLHPARKGFLLNMMAVFHGLGSMLAPLYAGRLLAAGSSWRLVYRWDWVLVAGMVLVFLFTPYPGAKIRQGTKLDLAGLRRSAFTPEMGWFYLAIAMYVALELGVASWIVALLQETRAQSVEASTASLSLFFLMVTLGRFVGSFIIERLGYLRSILFATLGSGVLIALGVYGPPGLAVCLPLSGIFISIIFPTITAEVSDRSRENMGQVLGVLFTFAGLGGMLGPWLIGVASDLLGIQLGFGVALLYALILGVAVVVLMRQPVRQSAEV